MIRSSKTCFVSLSHTGECPGNGHSSSGFESQRSCDVEAGMKAIVKRGAFPGIEVVDMPIPEIGEDEVLVQVQASGICGSDVHVYEWKGGYDWLTPYLPVVLGHEFSGVVAAVGKKVQRVREGDRVLARTSVTGSCGNCSYCVSGRRHFCEVHRENLTGWKKNGGFAEYYKAKENGVIFLPDGVSFEAGALAEPVSIGGCAVDDASITIGDSCLIIGPGTIGLLTLIMAKSAGAGMCVVCGTKKDTARLQKAKELGADKVFCTDETDLWDTVMKLTGGQGMDVVFDASGAAGVIPDAIECAKKATGRIVLEGIYSREVNLEFSNAVVRSARTIKGTYSGRVAWERTLEWMAYHRKGAAQCTEIITHRTHIKDAEAAFERCVRKENIKEMFTSFS